MVEMKNDVSYPLVYSLVTLTLILPVVTATVERVFSAMNIIKNRLRNRIGDQWMNDCLVTYIEKDKFKTIESEEIMQRFQNMKNCRGQLSKISQVWKNKLKFTFFVRFCMTMTITLLYSCLFILLLILINFLLSILFFNIAFFDLNF